MRKLLALNRGEIAIRIIRAASELDLRTVAIFSKADRLSLHRFKADEAYQVGDEFGPVQAYLDVDGIIDLAKRKGVDIIHPGYGFLAENPALPRACEKAGIAFVGPSAELLETLGDKTAARKLAERAGVPIVPGSDGFISDADQAAAVAKDIGFPLIIKAAFGGGGRGMRVVTAPEEFAGKLEEATKEALSAFGNGAVFLERYIRRARHIEIQLLGDQHGNILHLYERDCSVQRRHQKVVEVAPAPNLDPKLRLAITDAAVRIAREARYYSAGTAEFLVDADTGEFFFIEVNPRIQVEHTVTEMVTGIDLVRSQILIAQGATLHEAPLSLPKQDKVPLYGCALQCRVTTEDPTKGFVPDYGRIQTYRSPGGGGVRLDGASAYAGAVITPFYDSLLVKLTVWNTSHLGACARARRALREFRVRGVVTNIPFLENLVTNADFQAGCATTSFLDEHPGLCDYPQRKDRATKLLTYLADVIVNGNPEIKGKIRPARLYAAPKLQFVSAPPPSGTRQMLDKLGPEKFAEWTRKQKRLLCTDTTFRDAHQSLLATRMRTHDMMETANFVAHHLSGLYSLEMWGGATFDVAMRFLLEDPWQRLRRLREAIPNICFQMLLRASNAVGYTAYPDNAVSEFIKESADQGIDIFRIFDSLNWLPNMKLPMEAVLKTGRVCEAALCYTGDILDPDRQKYSLEYYVRMAKELEKMGAHILAIKDMAGLLKPYAAEKLVKALREEVGIPVHFHTHDTSGIIAASILKASDAGVDIVDTAIAPMAGQTSQPNLNSIAAALANTKRDTQLDFDALNQYAAYWENVRKGYTHFDTSPQGGTAEVYVHEMPGGQFTNLKAQAENMGLGAKWHEVASVYADVNRIFGDIVKVTPSSKVVGDLAIFLVTHNMTVEEFGNLSVDHGLSLPNSVIDMFEGSLGVPEGGWPPKIQKIVLGSKEPQTGRPGENLTPVNFDDIRAKVQEIVAREPSRDEVLSYVMYPEVFKKFAAARDKYGDVEVLPSAQFFFGMEKGEEITLELEAGIALIIKFLTVSDPHLDGTRTAFFELNGEPREITIQDKSLRATVPEQVKADPSKEGEVGAPLPGLITAMSVQQGQLVKKGDRLFVIEAMKLQSTGNAPISGKVVKLLAQPGQQVKAKDLLLVIEPVAKKGKGN